MQWYWIVSIVLGFTLWVLFGTNIFLIFKNSVYDHKKKTNIALIYGIFGGLLSSGALIGGLIGIFWGFYWLDVTKGGELPHVHTQIVKDTIYIEIPREMDNDYEKN